MPPRRSSARPLLLLLLLGGGVPPGAATAEEPEEKREIPAASAIPKGLDVEWRGTLTQDEHGTATFDGPVTLTWGDTRIQGDRMSVRERRYLEIEGNALIVWGDTRIYGARMTYDLDTERGVIEDAIGQTLTEYQFWAKRVEKIGADTVRLESATVTTCTQPVPYWSFAVSSATIHIDHYARMWNVRVRSGPVPLIYLPYIVWPVKQDRAPGLLVPELHSSRSRGAMYRQQLFIPLGRSADVTLDGRFYTEAGIGFGTQVRAIPHPAGRLDFSGFYIDDQVYAEDRLVDGQRYQIAYLQEQKFLNGFRMVADVNMVSDPDYYSDYERDLNVSSAPQTLARLEFSRNGPWVSTNIRELRREQLASGLVQQTLPEVELRGRSRRLGKTPFYLAFESSAASIQQRVDTSTGQPPFNPDYLRGDLLAVVTVPWSPTTWLDITPQVDQRLTYYTQRQQTVDDARVVEDRSLARDLSVYGIELVGPKFARIFRPERPGAQSFKHAIEPRVRYGYATVFDEADDILSYDEVDRVNGNGEQIGYALIQRLFAKRPRAKVEPARGATESVFLPDGTALETSAAEPAAEAPAAPGAPPAPGPGGGEPVEIARLDISQSHSFDEDLSRADTDGDGILETSKYSAVVIAGRYSPQRALSVDLRSSYDILFDAIRDVNVSGLVQSELARLRFSVVHNNGLGINTSTGERVEDTTQVRTTAGLSFADGRVLLNADVAYNSNPSEGVGHFPDQRWQVQYATQCCTFLFERLTRDFASSETRRELYLRVDLRGIGKVLSSTF
jgi:LPS-assembly protein